MEKWNTQEEIIAAKVKLRDTFEGWEPPFAHGVALVPSGSELEPDQDRGYCEACGGQHHEPCRDLPAHRRNPLPPKLAPMRPTRDRVRAKRILE